MVGEPIGAHVLPFSFYRIKFRGSRRQEDQGDIRGITPFGLTVLDKYAYALERKVVEKLVFAFDGGQSRE